MRTSRFFPLYAANLLLSFHYAILVYVNSSYLDTRFSKGAIGLLYAFASIIVILIFLGAPKIIRKEGLKPLLMATLGINLLATIGMAFAGSPWMLATLFILHESLASAAFFCLDIFLEDVSRDSHTGRTRAVYL